MRDDWVEVEFRDVLEIVSGKNQKQVADENGKYPIYGSGGIMGYANDYLCEEGTTIVGRKGTINSPIYVKEKFWNVDTAFGLSSFDGLDKRLLYFFSLSFNFKKLDKSTTIPSLAKRDLLKIIIPLAPLPEQRAIVAKIEGLSSDLDKGVADLKTAQAQLKIYRQAVVQMAFKNPNSKMINILDIVEKIQIGPFGSQLHKEDYIAGGIPLINPMHIKNGKIHPRTDYSILESKRDSLPNYILESGDVIMGRRGEMGRSALVAANENGWFCGTGSLYLRPNKTKIYPAYLNFYMQSSIVKHLLTGSATGTTMMNLNKKIISSLSIPILPLSEQHQIVREIELRLSVCDEVEGTILESLKKSEALRQSILKKAFEGKLLTAAELSACRAAADYEPAAVLLEKIWAEKK